MNSLEKQKIALRYWLLGMSNVDSNYLKVLEAMEYAASFHTGYRKDNVTPEFAHQISIAHYVRTLYKNLIYPVETLCAVFLHDVCEDYDIPYSEIERLFGKIVSNATERLTKVFRNVKKTPEEYFGLISECPIASVVKGGDRIHNLQSMPGVFVINKQKGYILESETNILPAIKKAKRNFPEQELAYENIKLMLLSQIYLINNTLSCQK